MRDGADPKLLDSYTIDGLDEIIEFLRGQNPDIITMQETHAKNDLSQTQQIAEALGYEGWVNDEWADSHIEDGQRIGQGVVCRRSIKEHSFEFFTNPNFEAVWEDGSIAKSHDKGRTRCRVETGDGQSLLVQTLHTVPFRRFHIPLDSDQAKKVLADMEDKLMTDETGVIQADFNVDTKSLKEIFPRLFESGFEEIPLTTNTSVRGHYFDHVLYRSLRVVSNAVIKEGIRTDKYPEITDFEL